MNTGGDQKGVVALVQATPEQWAVMQALYGPSMAGAARLTVVAPAGFRPTTTATLGMPPGQEKLPVQRAAVEPAPASSDNIRVMGRFRYLAGFGDVWLGDVHYDLRGRNMARLCMEYLVTMQAFDAASARHFVDEIDPYVRLQGRLGERGKFSDVQIKQYFNDRKARLPKLRQELIRSVEGTGKYYLQTGAALPLAVSPCFP